MEGLSLWQDQDHDGPGSPLLKNARPAPPTTSVLRQESPEVTVLSFGGGQDSTAILLMLIFDPVFRARYAPGRLVVVMSDTGDEHAHTYDHVRDIQDLCAQHDVEFHFLTPDRGYHAPTWRTLRTQYETNKNVGSKAYVKTCTWHLKIQPIYKWLEDWLGAEYGVPVGRRKGLYEFRRRYGRIRVLIGISAGEETRATPSYTDDEITQIVTLRKAQDDEDKAWVQLGLEKRKWRKARAPQLNQWLERNVEKAYPLIDLGMDRAACQAYIRGHGLKVPYPSNCVLCPYMSLQELLWLYRFQPEDYWAWVGYEHAKIREYQGRGTPEEKNFGVWGRKLLPQVLQEALQKYGHWSLEELDRYKLSHGHCVKSRY